MDPSDDTVAKPRNDSVASENSLASNLGAVAGSSLDEVKNTISSVAANESVQGVWSQVRYLAGGRSGGESQEAVDTAPSQEEIDLIDRMEDDKIAAFLREKNKSLARLKRK